MATADGSIVIKVDLDDKGLNKSVDGVEQKAQKGALGFKNLAKTALGVATAVGGFKLLTGSMDKAIKRVDTLDNAERVFENMGFSAKETDKMMTDLVDSINGLPTPLDEAVSAVQLMSAATGDLGKSQKVYSGLNNAILGFGGSTADVNNAVLQLSQAFANGRIDAQTWNSMINSQMGATLKAMSKMMGITMGELKEGLSDGSISVDDFIANLVELDEKGGGGLKSLQQIAQDATKGISTSMANAKTAVVRGVANMIKEADALLEKLGLGSIAGFISKVGSGLEKGINGIAQFMSKAVLEIDKGLKAIGLGGFKEILSQVAEVVKRVFDNIVKLAPIAIAMIVPLIKAFKSIYDFIEPLIPLIVGVATAFWTYGKVVPIIMAVVGAIKLVWSWLTTTVLLVKAMGILLSLNPLGVIIALLVGLAAGLVVAYHKSDAFREILSQVWEAIKVGIEWIGQFAQAIVDLFVGKEDGLDNLLSMLGLKEEHIALVKQGIDLIVEGFNWLKDTITEVLTAIYDFIAPLVVEMFEFVQTTIQSWIDWFNENSELIKQTIDETWNFIKEVIDAVLFFLEPLIENFLLVLELSWTTTWAVIKLVITTVWSYIKTIIDVTTTIIQGLITVFLQVLNGDWAGAWETIKETVAEVWDKMKGNIEELSEKIKGIISDYLESVKETMSEKWEEAKELVKQKLSEMISNLTSKTHEMIAIAKAKFNEIKQNIKNKITEAYNDFVRKMGEMVQSARNKIAEVKRRISEGIKSVPSIVGGAIGDAVQAVKRKFGEFVSAGANIVGSIADGIRGAIGRVTSAIGEVTSAIRRFLPFSPAKEGALRDIMDVQIVGSLVPGIKAQGKDAERALSSVTDDLHDTLDFGFMDKFSGLQARINGFKPVVNSSSMQTSTLVNENKALVAILNEQLDEFKKFNDKEFSATIGSREVTQSVNNENGKTSILNKFRNGGMLNV